MLHWTQEAVGILDARLSRLQCEVRVDVVLTGTRGQTKGVSQVHSIVEDEHAGKGIPLQWRHGAGARMQL